MSDTVKDQDEAADAPETAEERQQRKGGTAASQRKLKLSIALPEDSAFANLQNSLKERSAKFDPSDLVKEALEQVPAAWWEDKLEELTPLEFKIQMALKDPTMRERLSGLFAKS